MNVPLRGKPIVATTCPYCGVGCGVIAGQDARGGADIVGDPSHPASFGRLCSKGSALSETLGLESRLLEPMMRQSGGSLAPVSWDAALDGVAAGFRHIIERNGPEAVAFYLSGQLLTEDYYVANKLMKGFIGSANVDTNSRLCMASSVAGHRRAFGADVVPGTYDDLDSADLLVLVGSNTAWCHPVLFQRMVKNRTERGAKLIVIDPRRTVTGEEADLFLPIAPGMDTALFSGLLVHLADSGRLDRDYIEAHTSGFNAALERAREIAPDIATTAAATELLSADVAAFFNLFTTTPRTVTCFSQGVNQSAQGTDKVNAIINCHLATGRIGKPGMGPFSLTGQPNAMGGREVGGLANQLAAHMNFVPADIERVRRFWNAPRMAEREGLKAVAMFEAIARGTIKALWVMGTNPAMSLPNASAVRAALERLELFVVSENVLANDTLSARPHIVLPAAAWGEKEGTVTNSERRISRQRAFLPLPGAAMPDWWIVSQVASRLGHGDAFAYRSTAEIFREHARLSGFENEGRRAFDISPLAELSDADYISLAPTRWPVQANCSAPSDGRLFARGGFFTDDGKARFVAPAPPVPHDAIGDDFAFRLNTGRIRDQWHSMTRTGLSPRLASHLPEPFVEIHPDDALRVGVVDEGYARVSTAYGASVVRVVAHEGQRRGSLFVPIHWSAATSYSDSVSCLVAPRTDAISGQPESKATPATIAPVSLPLRGFVRSRRPISLPPDTCWTRVVSASGPEYRFATDRGPMFWHDVAHRLLGQDAELVEHLDVTGRTYRAAALIDGAIVGGLALGPADAFPQWSAIKDIVAKHAPLATLHRAAAAASQNTSSSPVVCACFQVTLATIREAIDAGAASVSDIATELRAGTNCGSCLPELKRIIARERVAHPV